MVKITFQTVSAQKPEKDNDEDKIIIPQGHVSLHTLFFFVCVLVICLESQYSTSSLYSFCIAK